MCKHDEQYQRDNEQAGGVGCPLCARERNAPPVVVEQWLCPACGCDVLAGPCDCDVESRARLLARQDFI